MTIERKFGRNAVMNCGKMKGFLLKGETLEDFQVRISTPKAKVKRIPKERKVYRKRPFIFGQADKTLIGTVTII